VKSLNIGETGSEREVIRYYSNAALQSERRKRLEKRGKRLEDGGRRETVKVK